MPHKADHLTRLHLKIEVLKRIMRLVVREGDVLKLHFTAHRWHRHRVFTIANIRLGVENLKHTLGRRHGAGRPVHHLAEVHKRLVELHKVSVEHGQLADGHDAMVLQHLTATRDPDDVGTRTHEQSKQWPVGGAKCVRLKACTEHRVGAASKTLHLPMLLGKSLYHLNARYGAIKGRVELADTMPHHMESGASAWHKPAGKEEDERRRNEHEQG